MTKFRSNVWTSQITQRSTRNSTSKPNSHGFMHISSLSTRLKSDISFISFQCLHNSAPIINKSNGKHQDVDHWRVYDIKPKRTSASSILHNYLWFRSGHTNTHKDWSGIKHTRHTINKLHKLWSEQSRQARKMVLLPSRIDSGPSIEQLEIRSSSLNRRSGAELFSFCLIRRGALENKNHKSQS